jgi:hypothetical protein
MPSNKQLASDIIRSLVRVGEGVRETDPFEGRYIDLDDLQAVGWNVNHGLPSHPRMCPVSNRERVIVVVY